MILTSRHVAKHAWNNNRRYYSSFKHSARLPLFKHDTLNRFDAGKVALYDEHGSHTYGKLFRHSQKVANNLTTTFLNHRRSNKNVAFLAPNNHQYLVAMLAIWKSGNVCVPLCKAHPTETLDYHIQDCQAETVVVTNEYKDKVYPIFKGTDKKVLLLDDLMAASSNQTDPELDMNSDALIIYTSGTTGLPKGVVLTHEILLAQIESMLEPWQWSYQDSILHVLPLHHTHGIVNSLLCPLYVGGSVVMLPHYDSETVWKYIQNLEARKVNIFMAVPTVYVKLLDWFKSATKEKGNEELAKGWVHDNLSKGVRLMVSGSAALPQPIFDQWYELTGHKLLERYGMTEIGMALTNPLNGERKPGVVGNPFPKVQTRIVESGTNKVLAEGNSEGTKVVGKEASGELQIKGPSVFKGYYNRPEATADEFTEDGWFKTGDSVQYVDGSYKILGRTSVDIIKSAGYKISALHVERLLLGHPDIEDVAVIGLSDLTYGQIVAAVVVLSEESTMNLHQLWHWGKEKMPNYMLPKTIKIMDQMPRNNMGKVNKKELAKVAFDQQES